MHPNPTSEPHLRPHVRPRRLAAVGLAALLASAAIGVAVVPPANVSATSATVIHVEPSGDDAAPGTAKEPVRTVTRGVVLAAPGDTVRIAEGTYHEQVQVYGKEVHIEAAPGADVVFDGAREVGSWTADAGLHWAPWSTNLERVGPPFTTVERPEAGWPEQFFLDGRPLAEVPTRSEVVAGTFFHDVDAGRVWIADDPTVHSIAGSDLEWGIYLNRADGSSLAGVHVERYATPNAAMAAVRAYADDLSVTDVVVSDNARIGLSVMGSRIRLDHVTALDNGHLGLHAHRTDALTISDSVVVGNNREGFDPFHSAGGVKVTSSNDVVIERSDVSDNGGPGIWTDLGVTSAVVQGNRVVGNARSGIELELSTEVLVLDNTVLRNGEAGVWVLESTEVEVWHNAVHSNVREIWVEDGPRADVVSVTIANNLLGGDPGNLLGGDPGRGSATAILSVDDWTEHRSAGDMGVDLAGNRYWLVPGSLTTAVSRWANWPAPVAVSTSIDTHLAATGSDAGSDVVRSDVDPFGRSVLDARQPPDAPLGSPVTGRVAAVLAIESGARRPAGPITAPAWPTTHAAPRPPDGEIAPLATRTGGAGWSAFVDLVVIAAG